MRGRCVRGFLAGALLLAGVGCTGGNVAYRDARKAELRKDWDTALINYERVVQSDPENAKYLIHERYVRTQATFYHLKLGRRHLAAGRMDEAAGEFQKAVNIDPTNEAAAQELGRLLAAQAAAKRAREASLQQALKAREQATVGTSVKLKSLPPEPLAHFRISADSRRVYETLGKMADLNVAFTADFQPRPVAVDLSNVRIEDALRIIALQTKTFWRPVTPNTILVVPDTPANRRDFDEEVLKTFYLSSPLAAADRTAITTALKQVLGLQRLVENPDANAIIIRDTPSKVSAAEKLIRDLDRGKAEILVDVSIIEADRNRVRDLGLLPGTEITALFTPGGSATAPILPLNRLGRLSTRDYSLTLPSALARALLTDSHTRILQNPQIRVTDGLTAKLRIGSRIPYATGSFGIPGAGGIGGGGAGGGFGFLANTQFQYQDVGVNLDLTPRLTSTGEVAIKAMIEISSLQAPIQVGGFSQPTFGQRRIEHDIRLKEGEVSLLGGLLETKETRTFGGLAGLGQIPILKYLFSGERRERTETEVLIMLTPRVIRLPELRAETEESVPVGMGGTTGPLPMPPPVPIQPEVPPGTPPEQPGQPQ